jgi:transposase
LGKPSQASCTEGGPWESIAKFLWLLMSPRRSTPSRSRKAAGGEVRFLGDVENSPLPIERTIRRLADDRLQVCFEAGPMGYGLYRQVEALGHDRMVVAPALIPKRSGERIKTNRRDAVTLARLQRPGELTPNRPFAGSEQTGDAAVIRMGRDKQST